jgi:transcriptional regulator with XRE-family HTH domain
VPNAGKANPVYAQIGKLIKDARKAAKLTQEKLGGKLSLSRTSIANIEKGRQQILVHTLLTIAQELRIPMNYLIPEQKPQIEIPQNFSSGERDFVLSVSKETKKKK